MTTTPDTPRIEYRRLAFGVYLPAFLRMFGAALCGIYIPLYIADLGASKATIGMVLGAQAAGRLTADLPAGLLVSRLGTRHAMVTGLLGMGLAFVLAGAVPGVILFGGCLFVAGFCSALVQISQLTIMRHAMPDHVRGRALSLFGGNARLARVVAPLLGGLMVQAIGYRSVLWCNAGLLVAGCGLFGWLSPHQEVETSPPGEAPLSGVLRLVKEHGRLLLSAGGILLVLAMLRTSRSILLPLWGRGMGLSPATIGMVVSAGAAVDTFLFPLSGIISDRKGRKWSLACNLAILSLGLLALAAVGSTLTGFLAATIVIGFGNGLGSGINMTIGSDLAPKGRDTGPFLGLWRVVTDTGAVLGPLAVGALAQALALGPAAIIMSCGGLGCVALVAKFMPESRGLRH